MRFIANCFFYFVVAHFGFIFADDLTCHNEGQIRCFCRGPIDADDPLLECDNAFRLNFKIRMPTTWNNDPEYQDPASLEEEEGGSAHDELFVIAQGNSSSSNAAADGTTRKKREDDTIFERACTQDEIVNPRCTQQSCQCSCFWLDIPHNLITVNTWPKTFTNTGLKTMESVRFDGGIGGMKMNPD